MLTGLGIAITVTPNPANKARLGFEIACRLARATVLESKLDLPAGIFLTVVHSASQRPMTMNLVEDRVLFDDDATDNGSQVVAVMRGELDTSDGPQRPFLLHASCFEFVSNVIHVS